MYVILVCLVVLFQNAKSDCYYQGLQNSNNAVVCQGGSVPNYNGGCGQTPPTNGDVLISGTAQGCTDASNTAISNLYTIASNPNFKIGFMFYCNNTNWVTFYNNNKLVPCLM